MLISLSIAELHFGRPFALLNLDFQRWGIGPGFQGSKVLFKVRLRQSFFQGDTYQVEIEAHAFGVGCKLSGFRVINLSRFKAVVCGEPLESFQG
jgi:hypothetical protein